jgi:signal transduction histidine kinase
MGIGVSLSRSVVARHQCLLWGEPDDGPDATFAISIPCGRASVRGARYAQRTA